MNRSFFFLRNSFLVFILFSFFIFSAHAEEQVAPEKLEEPVIEQQNIEPVISTQSAGIPPTPIPPKDETPKVETDFLRSVKNMQGSFDVDLFSGGASYNYTLQIPAGRNGLTPPLNLSYSSNNRRYDSLVGYGWDLPISSIYRNTVRGSQKLFSENDFSVSLNGQSHDLIVTDTTNNIYQAQNETNFSQYQYDPANKNWIVTDTSGTKYFFGNTTDTRQDDPNDSNRVYRWMLERVEDLNGNFITYKYFKNDGQIYPDTIRYTGHGNNLGTYEIKFLRMARTPYTSYNRGFKTANNFIISEVEVFHHANGNPEHIYTYKLSHDNTGNALTYLTQIQLQKSADFLPPTVFQYYDGTENISGKKLGLLKTIIDPLGGEKTLTYKPSTAYRTNWGTTGMKNKIPFIVHTLHKLQKQADPSSPLYTTTYEYENGHYYYDNLDAYKKEYAGFHNVNITDPENNVKKLYFHQSEFSFDDALHGEYQDHISKKGRIYREEQYDQNNNLYTRTINKWKHATLPDQDPIKERFFVSLDQTTNSAYDGNSLSKNTGSQYKYDTHGNQIQHADYGEVTLTGSNGDFTDIGNDTVITDTEYAVNATKYIFQFPKKVTRTSNAGTILSSQKYWYDQQPFGNIQNGNQTQAETQIDLSGNTISTQTQYNSFGLPTQHTDARGGITSISYDAQNLLPISRTNPLGHTTQTSYDYRFGSPKTITDPNNNIQEHQYDNFGRIVETKQSDPNGSPNQLLVATETQYDFTIYPAQISRKTHTHNQGIDIKSYTYLDGFGKNIQTRNEADNNQYQVVHQQYDGLDRVQRQFVPILSAGHLYQPPSPNAIATENDYDALGRTTAITTQLGTTTTQYYEWNQKITDPKGNFKVLRFDARQNLIQVEENLKNQTFTTTYGYDLNNNLIQLKDALGNERNQTFDLIGNRLSREQLHPSGIQNIPTWHYIYDEHHNLIQEDQPNGNTIIRKYDALDRPITEDSLNANGIENTYTYDTGNNALGRVNQIKSNGSTIEYTYDRLGRITEEIRTIDGNQYQTRFEYDFLGNPTKITYPEGSEATYSYNTAGQTVEIAHQKNGNTTAIVNHTQYAPTGAVSQIEYGNNIITDSFYDIQRDYLLTNRSTNGNNTIFQDIDYSYDNIGNIIQLRDSSQTALNRTVNYDYDELYRLVDFSITANGQTINRSYDYDILGNIVSKSDQSGTYQYTSNHPHAVTSVGGQSFSYDLHGNMTGDGNWTHSWNWQDRIRQSTDGNDTVSYKYDHTGTRTYKRNLSTGKKTIYVNKYFDQEDGDEKVYLYLGNQKIATVSNGDPIFHHPDHLTGTSVDTDASGNINQVTDYYPFGDERVDINYGSFENDYRFTGKERDEDTSLMYYDARYYDSGIGRFISRDAWEGNLSDPQSLNKYSYVRNNPVKYVDPSGNTFSDFIVGLLGIDTAYSPSETTNTNAPIYENQVHGNIGTAVSLAGGMGAISRAGKIANRAENITEVITKNIDKVSNSVRNVITKGLGKAKNKIGPNLKATGPHTVFKRGKNGNITNYKTYSPNPQNPTGFDQVKKVDMVGRGHKNTITGENVKTPHVQGKNISGGVRPANQSEIPGSSQQSSSGTSTSTSKP